MEKLIITVAPTGSVPKRRDTRYVPVNPDEIAETAYLCEQEGASIIHVHCRDQNESPTSDYRVFKETVDKVRKRTHLIVMTSTSGVAGKSDEERAEPLKTRPEMASLTTGSLNFSGRRPSSVYVNTWETVTFLAEKMRESEIKPELEAFDVGFVQQGKKLAEQGFIMRPAHFQLVMGVDGGIPATIDNLLHMVHQIPSDASFCVAGVGRCQLPMTTLATLIGGHVRVGLEDNIYYAKGKPAPNEDFVARAKRIAQELQRETATPEESREILKLRKE